MKKVLSFVLAVCLLVGCLPLGVSALTSAYSNHSSAYKNSTYYSQLSAVNLTGNYADDIVAVALSQKGYHEANSTAGYGGGTSGSSNYCEYNRNYWGKDVSGSNYAWCTIFVMWCARQARIPLSIIPNHLTTVTSGKSNFYSKMPSYNAVVHSPSGYTPQKGDLLITGDGNHIGIVTANASGGKVTYISGNINNSVDTRTLNVSSAKAYITPNYGGSSTPVIVSTPTVKNVTAKANGSDVTVTWSDVSGETSYNIYLVQAPWAWEDIKYRATVSANVTSYTFSGVADGEYCAFVISMPNGTEAQSNWAGVNVSSKPAATPAPPPATPPIPTGVAANASKNSVTVTWNDVSGESSYNVYILQAPWSWESIKYSATVNANVTSYTFTDIADGEYCAFVIAMPNAAEAQSNWASFSISSTAGTDDTPEPEVTPYDPDPEPTPTAEPAATPTPQPSAAPTPTPQPAASGFSDVEAGAYYAAAVMWAVDKGITLGTSATTFSPNDSCTRAQAVTFLWRAAGSPEPRTGVNPFADVEAGSYYEKAVLWAVETGVTNGTGAGTFSPSEKCSRAQIVTFQYRAAGSPAVSGGASFSDVPADQYYSAAVAWAVANGITNGTGNGKFSPGDTCTRGQIVTFLYRDLADQ